MSQCTWRSENSLKELVLSLYHVDLGAQTQAFRLGRKCLYLLNHLAGL